MFRKKMQALASILVLTMVLASLAACSSNNNSSNKQDNNSSPSKVENTVKTDEPVKTEEKDTITALLPPISASYQANFEQMSKDFNTLYPNLTLKIEPASWEDMTQKLDTQVNAGSPPDIAFIGSDGISKYAQLEMIMDITDAATPDMIGDFDKGPLEYMRNGKGLYGFPGYMSVHSIGGNKQFMEDAGIDWKKIQKEGWTYDEFRDAIKKGVVKDGDSTSRYGFVFATSGVTSKDYLNILVKNAGMPSPFTDDLKYAYTSKNFLEVLKAIRQLIDDGSMPKELSSVDGGKRWNMFLTGQTMITGKGLTVFENSAKLNNAKIDANDGSAVKESIKVEYIVLPVPSFLGKPPVTSVAVDGYVTFRGKKEPTAEHKANVVKAAYFLASGKVAATTNNELFLPDIANSSRKAAEGLSSDRNPDNIAAAEAMMSHATPARPDIPVELGAQAIKLETEVIIPKLQALLADEIKPEAMFEEVKAAAISAFGKDGVIID